MFFLIEVIAEEANQHDLKSGPWENKKAMYHKDLQLVVMRL